MSSQQGSTLIGSTWKKCHFWKQAIYQKLDDKNCHQWLKTWLHCLVCWCCSGLTDLWLQSCTVLRCIMVETFLKAIVTPQVRWPEFLQWKITYLEILTNVIGCYWFTGLIHSVCGSRSCAGIWFQTRIAHQNTLRLGTVCLPHTLPQTTQVRCINSDVPSSICVMICVQSF